MRATSPLLKGGIPGAKGKDDQQASSHPPARRARRPAARGAGGPLREGLTARRTEGLTARRTKADPSPARGLTAR